MASITWVTGDVRCDMPLDKKFHACLMDPPYQLGKTGFMGNKWDRASPVMGSEFWEQLSQRLLPGALVFCFAGSYRYHRVASAAEDAGFEVMPMIAWAYGTGMGFGRRHKLYKTHIVGAQSLRPAIEPVVVLQWSTDGLAKSECLSKYGTGGINIDDSMIEYGCKKTLPSNILLDDLADNAVGAKNIFRVITSSVQRVPTAIIYSPKASTKERDGGLDHMETLNHGIYKARQDGSMSGGVYHKRNPHPTVKPLKLTIALARMLLPPKKFTSSLIVPFSGVGSEVIGAAQAGFEQITGIELSEDYVDIAMHRVRFHLKEKEGLRG